MIRGVRSVPLAALATGLVLTSPAAAQVAPSLPEVAGASVELSWSEVRGLLERLIRQDVEGASRLTRPPVDALLDSAAFTVSIGDGTLAVDGTVEIEVLSPGWTTVPILGARVAVRSATLPADAGVTGQLGPAPGAGSYAGAPSAVQPPSTPARLVYGPDGGIAAVFQGAGTKHLALSYAVALDPGMGPRSVVLPMPRAASTEVTFLADARLEDVEADGAVRVRSVPLGGDGGHAYTFAVRDPDGFALRFVVRRRLVGPGPAAAGAGPRVGPDGRVVIEPGVPAEETKPPRFRVGSAVDVAIDPVAVRAAVRLDLEIHDAPLESFRMAALPDWDLVVATLEGSDEPLRTESDGEWLVVRFAYQVENRAVVVLVLEQGNERRRPTVASPVISVDGAYRQEGVVGFRLDSAIEGAVARIEGGSPADPSEIDLPGGVSAQFGFRFHRVPYAAEMSLRYHQPREVLTAAIDRARILAVTTREGKTAVAASYVVRNSRHSYLAVEPPVGAEVWGAFIDGRPVQAGRREDRPGVVLVPLPRPEAAPGVPMPFVVEVSYYRMQDPVDGFSGWSLELPKVDLPIASIDVDTYLPQDLDYRGTEGTLRLVAGPARVSARRWTAADDRGAVELGTEVAAPGDATRRRTRGLGNALAAGALAARFEIPTEGVLLSWHGAIVLPGEAIVVEAGSRPRWVGAVSWAGSMLLLVAAGALLAAAAVLAVFSRRRLAVALVLASVPCWAGAGVSALLLTAASPMFALLGPVLFAAVAGGRRLVRWQAALRASSGP